MTADLGTRKGAKIEDVLEGSRWVNGEDWFMLDQSEFPIKTVEELSLTDDDLRAHESELLKADVTDNEWIHEQLSRSYATCYAVLSKTMQDKITERYAFSSYIMDPLRFRFRKVVRIVALVFLFITNLKLRVGKDIGKVENDLPEQFKFINDKFIVTSDSTKLPFVCPQG